MKKTVGLHSLYRRSPELADQRLWGREAHPVTRRGFIKGSGLAAMYAALGASIPFAEHMPAGLIPAALADDPNDFVIPGKDGLVVLNDRPLNAETPAHLLDDAVTPASRVFVRNNGVPPNPDLDDADRWTLRIDGEALDAPVSLSLGALKSDYRQHTLALVIECAGNGRSEFYPAAKGNQWTTGAVACPEWTGVRLADVLEPLGVGDNAVYVAYEGADTHLTGDPSKRPISRGIPMAKALEKETLLAFAMNGEPLLPLLHGFPLRLVAGGWPASVSGKWLKRLMIRDRVHDGEKMLGQSYRVPCEPVAPGADVSDDDMCIIESMPVKSLITSPRSGVTLPQSTPLAVRGHAWAGDLEVRAVYTSIDFGASWQRATLERPANRLPGSSFRRKSVSRSPAITRYGRAPWTRTAKPSRCCCPAGIRVATSTTPAIVSPCG